MCVLTKCNDCTGRISASLDSTDQLQQGWYYKDSRLIFSLVWFGEVLVDVMKLKILGKNFQSPTGKMPYSSSLD